MPITTPISRAINASVNAPLSRAISTGTGGASVDPSNRVMVAEGDSISSVLGSYPRIFEGYASPPFTAFYVSAVAGSTIATGPVARAATNIAKKSATGSNIYTIMIGRNDLTTMTTTQWLTAMAAHCDVMRAAGFRVGICTILPSTVGGSFNSMRATVNTEMRLWTTDGSVISGIHADFIVDFDTTSMGPDAAASDVGLYYDGTHPTAAGQVILEALYRTVVNAETSAGVVAAPQPSVASGIYGSSQNVTLTSATSGAAIYYTLDSTDPSTASTLYTGAITVSASQTIRALAAKAGMTNSAANDCIYTFGGTPDLTNIVAWYKFNAGINNTSGVKRWEDRLFGHHIAQATLARRPSVSSGIISCNAQYLQNTFGLTQPCTFYALMRQDTWASLTVLMDGTTGNSALYQLSASPGIEGYAGTFSSENANATLATFVAVCVVFNGASSVLRVNNTTPVTGNFGAGNAGGLTLGANFAGTTGLGRVSFKEVTVYSVAHGTTEQDAEITRLLAL